MFSSDEVDENKPELPGSEFPRNINMDRSISIDEGFSSRGPSERKPEPEKVATLERIKVQTSNI
jgi:hypothetical protein